MRTTVTQDLGWLLTLFLIYAVLFIIELPYYLLVGLFHPWKRVPRANPTFESPKGEPRPWR